MTSYSGPSGHKKLHKPIVKFSQSEKNSLDLNRSASEQSVGLYGTEYGAGSRSVHDVSFQSSRRGYHTRTTSGASQFSNATTGSGRGNGSFVHPFQQTPRPFTPPISQSYHSSSFHMGEPDSPREADRPINLRTNSNLSNHSTTYTETTSPILSSLRITTKNSSTSRLAQSLSNNLNNSKSNLAYSNDILTPKDDDLISPMKLNSDSGFGFRMRSRSEGVEARNNEPPDLTAIQKARREFQEKERIKQEKAEIAEVKALEKRNRKEARAIEKQEKSGRPRKSTGGSESAPSMLRPRARSSKSDLSMVTAEKSVSGNEFMAQEYGQNAQAEPPRIGNDAEEGFQRISEGRRRVMGGSVAKKKTHSAWTSFMIWLRTRFLGMTRSERGH